jgi:hypothetical protein
MDINYVCSFGTLCHSTQMLNNLKLKTCSYPFDWVFTTPEQIIHIIQDDFKIYLDKSYYRIIKHYCGHDIYHTDFFRHHNPLNNEEHYNYFKRCIHRFRELLKRDGLKQFVVYFPNIKKLDNECYERIRLLDNCLMKYTKNYKILCILHFDKKTKQYYNFINEDRIDFLELHTISSSNGLNFENIRDTLFLNTIINVHYKYNILEL